MTILEDFTNIKISKNVLFKVSNRNRAERRSFAQIQKDHQSSLGEGRLYEDPEFPANPGSLFCTGDRPRYADDIEWLRPHDICDDPQLYVGGHSQFDIVQGQLGDCWLLAAMAAVSRHDSLMRIVLPPENDFGENYCGAFLVQLWQYTQWMDVIVDDRLPCIDGKLVYLSSDSTNEFWSAIIEKAYAKLNGSYEALSGGSTSEALADFTSGIPETFELGDYGSVGQKIPSDLHRTLRTSFEKGAVGGASVEVSGAGIEADAGQGLIAGHAYTLETAVTLEDGTELVCLRNPWGQAEWNGPWSDGSAEWDNVSSSALEKCGMEVEEKDDGEFWMEFNDFIRYFSKVELCMIPEDIIPDQECNWVTSLHESKWVSGVTAGGCTNFQSTFWRNPQFLMTLIDVDDDSETDCSFIASLLQSDPDRRRKQKDLLTIGFIIYKLDGDDVVNLAKEPVTSHFFKTHRSVARSDFVNSREVTKRAKLPPGNYVIVPCTFQPNEESQFVMRIFSEKKQEVSGQTCSQTNIEEPSTPDRPISEENEKRFFDFFERLAGRDQAISALELQDILNKVAVKCYGLADTTFQLETCRAIVAAGDPTCRGKLNFNGFKNVWLGVRKWMEIFIEFDQDKSGTFDAFELRDALKSAGMVLSTRVLTIISIRYANESMRISLSDFVLMAVRLKSALKRYFKLKPDMPVDEWVQMIIYS